MLGAGEKFVRGSWLQTVTHTLEGRAVTAEGSLSSRTFCQGENVLDPPCPGGSHRLAAGGPSTCNGTGVGQNCTDHLRVMSIRVNLGSHVWLVVTKACQDQPGN